jgi:hypothetical protein
MNEEQKAALDKVIEALGDIESSYHLNDYHGKRELRSRWMRAAGEFERTL